MMMMMVVIWRNPWYRKSFQKFLLQGRFVAQEKSLVQEKLSKILGTGKIYATGEILCTGKFQFPASLSNAASPLHRDWDDDDDDDDIDDDDSDDDIVQAGNRGHIFENVLLVSELLCHNSSDKMMTMIMVTSYFPKAASMFWYNASETPVGQFEYAPK